MKKINLYFIITSLINSFLLIKITSGYNNLRFLIGDLIVILIVVAFSYFFKKRKLYFLIWSIILSVLCCINSLYYNEFNDFMSIKLISILSQAFALPSEATTDVFEILDFIFIWQILVMLIVYIKDKFEYNRSYRDFKSHIVSSFVLLVFLILSMNSNDIYRISHEWNKVYKANNFGIYSYQVSDVFHLIKSNFDSISEKELNEMNEFYETKEVVTNEYTNIFKDKNVIFIHGESIQSLFIDEEINNQSIMPNLSRLKEEGLYFSNFYSQESVGTSSDTELTLNNSILPVGVGTAFVSYDNNTYQALPKKLSELGYYTFSMHGNTCEYWNREVMHKNLGYNHFYCYNDYDLSDTLGLGLSDKSFFSQSADIIKSVSDKKFSATLIMLSNHAPFDTNEQVNFDVGYMEGTKLGNYIKLLHYVDEAIGEFINKLDRLDLLDDTVIVIYGDHDAKIKVKDYEKYFDEEIDFYEYEKISRVPLIIWTKDNLVSGEVDEIMGMIDVFPTLGNMFGFSSNYSLGNDIFSTNDNIVVFPNGNWVTNKVYYNNQNSEYKLYEEVDKNYLKEKEEYAKKIVEISNNLIKYNLMK